MVAADRELDLLVQELAMLSAPGGILEDYVFHGTDKNIAEQIAKEGVTSSYAVKYSVQDDSYEETLGTHWGTARVASFYAKDQRERYDDPELSLVLIAARKQDLEQYGEFAVDGQTLDCPLSEYLDLSEEEVYRRWDVSAKDWNSCFELYGTILVLGDIPPDEIVILQTPEDIEHFLLSKRCLKV